MTENEAIKELQEYVDNSWGDLNDSFNVAIQALEELQQYREYKEIFKSHFTKEALELLRDKEEFGKWLERGKWIAKKCDEINRKLGGFEAIGTIEEFKALKEKNNKFIELPCEVNDTVFCILERRTRCTENDQEFDEYSCQGCECLECDSVKEKYISEQKAYTLEWIVSNRRKFGKTMFLTKEEAEKELANKA